jgi:NhaP-type Na+/H+ or K+/H+ antiporter
LLFILSVVFFYLYGLRFDSEKPNPYDSGDVKVFLALGIIIFVIATILAIMILGVYFPLLFKNSQELYSKTKEHKEQVSKYNDEDLTKFNENELK